MVELSFAEGVVLPEAGRFEVWSSLRYPDGGELRAANAPLPFPLGEPIRFEGVPYGDGLTIEVLFFPTEQTPNTGRSPAYFGRSSRFDFFAGADLRVPVEVGLRPAPGTLPRVLEVNGEPPGRASRPTPTARVDLLVQAEGIDALEMARDARFTVDRQVFEEALHRTGEADRYRFTYDLSEACREGACEGPQTLFLRGRADRFLSEAGEIRVVFDTLPPSLFEVRFSPSVVKTGDRASLQILTSERLGTDAAGRPRVELTWEGPAPSLEPVPPDGTLYGQVFQVPDDPSLPSTYRLTAVRLEDAVGNGARYDASSSSLLPLDLTVDAEPPTLTCGEPRCPAVSATRVRPGDVIDVSFELTEMPASLALALGGRPIDCPATAGPVSCPITVTEADGPADIETNRVLTVSVADAAGNLVTAQRSLLIDRGAPTLVSADLEPAIAGVGDVVSLAFAASEALDPDFSPALRLESGEAAPIELNCNPSFASLACRALIGPEETSGSYRVLGVRLRDVLGNEAERAPNGELTLTVDTVPPEPTLGPIVDRVGPGDTLVVSVDPGAETTWMARGTVRGRPLTCVTMGGTSTCRYTYSADGREVGGAETVTEPIVIEVEDAAGNVGQVGASVIADFEPPTVVPLSASVTFVPGAGNPLGSGISALTAGSRLRITFNVSEELQGAPAVEAVLGGTALDLGAPEAIAGRTYTYVFAPTAGTPEGTWQIRARLEDLAGNVSTETLWGTVVVDRTPPAPPDVGTRDQVVLHRAPWGRADPPGSAGLTVSGVAGSVEREATVVVNQSGTSVELGRTRALQDGSFPELPLSASDAVSVDVTAVDSAGNASLPAAVRDGSWTVTLVGKIPGSRVPNPHGLGIAQSFLPWLVQSDGELGLEPSQSGLARAAQRGGGVLEARARPIWEEVTGSSVLDVVPAQVRASVPLAADLRRGRIVGYGGALDPGTSLTGYSNRTLERRGGRYREVEPVARINPGPWIRLELAYDAQRGRTVLFGQEAFGSSRTRETWEWDGARWYDLTPSSGSPQNVSRMVYDERRGQVVLLTARNDVFLWSGTAWSPLLTSGQAPATGPAAYDPVEDTIVVKESSSSRTFTLSGTTWRLVSQSGPPGDGFMAFDPVDGEVLFAGSQTWSLEQGVWQQRSSAGVQGRLVLDPSIGRLIAETGSRGARPRVWTGTEWVELFQPLAAGVLAHETSSSASYLAADGRLYRWSGFGWAVMGPGLPAGRAIDAEDHPARGRMQLYVDNASVPEVHERTPTGFSLRGGGIATSGTAVWDEATRGMAWVHRTGFRSLTVRRESASGTWSTTQPTWPLADAPSAGSLAFAPSRNAIVLFGGTYNNGFASTSDFLELAGAAWRTIPQTTPWPTARSGATVRADPDRSRLLLFGGESVRIFSRTPLFDTWVYDASGWRQLDGAGDTPRSPIEPGAHAYDRAEHRWLVRDGESTYALGRRGGSRPAILFNVDLSASAIETTAIEQISASARAGGDGDSGAGVLLEVWDASSGAWEVIASGADPTSQPGALLGSSPDPGEARRWVLPDLGSIRFALRTAGTDAHPGGAAIALDAIETTVRYRLPPP